MKTKTLILLLLILVISFAGCTSKQEAVNTISFTDLSEKIGEDEYGISKKMEGLDGEVVEIAGYMSPLSPLGSNFFYMIQVPGAACPFCDGADVDFLQVIQVYSHDGKEVDYEEKAIKVTGILEVGEKTDENGVTSIFRIKSQKIDEHKF